MEDYIRGKRAICLKNQPVVDQVAEKLDEASEVLKSKISEINIYLSGSGGNIMETGRDRSPINYVLRLRDELIDSFCSATSMSEITDDLPNSDVFDDAFNKFTLLNECFAYCLSTIDLVISGHDTYPNLIQEEGMANDIEAYQKELNCCKEDSQLLAKFENVVKLFADLETNTKSQLVQQLRQEVEAIDPVFHRVPLSAWLNLRRNDLAITHMESCSKKLKDSFAKIAGHDEAVSIGLLDDFIDPQLMSFVQKNMTEYFGNDDTDADDVAYDFQRFIAHLTGKKKKLTVAVENYW